ncbi:MAG: hypothetical protein ACD_75C01696G0001, partial [uncultured bacterium]
MIAELIGDGPGPALQGGVCRLGLVREGQGLVQLACRHRCLGCFFVFLGLLGLLPPFRLGGATVVEAIQLFGQRLLAAGDIVLQRADLVGIFLEGGLGLFGRLDLGLGNLFRALFGGFDSLGTRFGYFRLMPFGIFCPFLFPLLFFFGELAISFGLPAILFGPGIGLLLFFPLSPVCFLRVDRRLCFFLRRL